MNVNYIKIINRFWDAAPEQDGYKSDHATLFFAVLDTINRNGWKDTEIEYDRLIYKVRLGKKNYLDSRRWLVTNRYLTCKEGRGNYAKAKFGLGHAVLGRTGSDTGNDSQPVPVPVPDAVLPNTGSDTGMPMDAVPDSTGSDTGIRTGTDTGSRTHLIINNKPLNLQTLKQQQQPDLAPLESGGDAGEQEEGFDLAEKKEERPNPPTPLPTADEVRAELLPSGIHRRYAIEQLKLAQSEADYAGLIELFITQQQCSAETGQPPFKKMGETRRHFTNWLGKRTELQTNNAPNGTHKRTNGTLRPTSIGEPDYRGKGSPCDVDL